MQGTFWRMPGGGGGSCDWWSCELSLRWWWRWCDAFWRQRNGVWWEGCAAVMVVGCERKGMDGEWVWLGRQAGIGRHALCQVLEACWVVMLVVVV